MRVIDRHLPFSQTSLGNKRARGRLRSIGVRGVRGARASRLGRPLFLIPAYNEANYLGRTLALLHSANPSWELTVIDDGSNDLTPAVCQRQGCEVVRLGQNRGKGPAFFSALGQFCIDRGKPRSVVMIDADLIGALQEDLLSLVECAQEATEHDLIRMTVATVFEQGNSRPEREFSGTRSFSWRAAVCLSKLKRELWPPGFALERCFELFFPEPTKVTLEDTRLLFRPMFGNQLDVEAARRQIEQMASYQAANRKDLGQAFWHIATELDYQVP